MSNTTPICTRCGSNHIFPCDTPTIDDRRVTDPAAHLDAAKRAIDIANRFLADVLAANANQDWAQIAEHCKTMCVGMIELMEEVAK